MDTNKKIADKIIYPELSYKITGLLFDTQNELGNFAREKQYGDLLEQKLKKENIPYKRELPIGKDGNILDFLIEDKIILELKSARAFTRDNYRQIQNYLQSTGIKLGLLVNFRSKYLKPERIIRIDH